jgi:adenine-specific DNA-methyltransferase
MHYGYVFARAYVAVPGVPRFPELAERMGSGDDSMRTIVAHLNTVPAEAGFIHDNYTPAGQAGERHGRMYFTPRNAARIDTIRAIIEDWRTARLIDDDAFHVLLAALIEAADRVANTTGVYAAFVKSWQPNAVRPIELREPTIVEGNGCRAERIDAIQLVRRTGPFDVLYLDPPYNTRQYAGYYHIPELIATGWFDGPVRTRGKTGLITDDDKRSDWSRAKRCETAFEELVAAAQWKHLVMSYNAEGIIPERVIERVLLEHGRRSTYEKREIRYKRYRSDADGAKRRYRADEVKEYLYCATR